MPGEGMAKAVEDGIEEWKKKFFDTLKKTEPLIAVLVEGIGPLFHKIVQKIDDKNAIIDLDKLPIAEAMNKVGEIQLKMDGVRQDALVYDERAMDALTEMAKASGVKIVISDKFMKDGNQAYLVAFIGKNAKALQEFSQAYQSTFDMNYIKNLTEQDYVNLINYMGERTPDVQKIIADEWPSYIQSKMSLDEHNATRSVDRIVNEIETQVPLTREDKMNLRTLLHRKLPGIKTDDDIRELSEDIIAAAYFSHVADIDQNREAILSTCDGMCKKFPDKADTIQKFKILLEQMPEKSAFFFNFGNIMTSQLKQFDKQIPPDQKLNAVATYLENAYKAMNINFSQGIKIDSGSFLSALSQMLEKSMEEFVEQFNQKGQAL